MGSENCPSSKDRNTLLKSATCSFGEEIQTQKGYIYNMNEVTIQNIFFFQ